MKLMRYFNYFIVCFIATLFTVSTSYAAKSLKPFTAEYTVKYRGLSLGKMQQSLTISKNKNYVFKQTMDASIPFVNLDAKQQSEGLITTRVQPLHYQYQTRYKGKDRLDKITFDWRRKRASFTYKNRQGQLPIKLGDQDQLSCLLQVRLKLIKTGKLKSCQIINGDRRSLYQFTRLKKETLETTRGPLSTLKLSRQRSGSSRNVLMWLAPELDYLPVKIEQYKKGKRQFTLILSQ